MYRCEGIQRRIGYFQHASFVQIGLRVLALDVLGGNSALVPRNLARPCGEFLPSTGHLAE